MKKVLIVEDDPQIAELLRLSLEDLSFKSEIVNDGLQGFRAVDKNDFDLILLDVMLPSMDGLELCRAIRAKNIPTPIIMITARTEEIDKVLGLETGADDYITKPFSVREMQARVKAVMRRFDKNVSGVGEEKKKLNFDRLVIDIEKRAIYKDDQEIILTNKEFDLLQVLASKPGKSFNRQSLLHLVWGYDFEGLEHTVNSHINRIRSKIEDDMGKPVYIQTTWGYGYRFNENL